MISHKDSVRHISDTDQPSWIRRQSRRLGRLLRWPYNRLRFRAFGRRARIDYPSYVVGGAGIEIGAGVLIGRHARLEAHFVGEGTCRLRIGDNTRIAPYVHIGAAHSVEIGANCGIGSYSWITDHDHDTNDPVNCVVTNRRVVVAPTVLEDGVYIGERVAILRGVRIGAGSVVGTNSVVTRDVPPLSVVVGCPARIIRRLDLALGKWIHPADGALSKSG